MHNFYFACNWGKGPAEASWSGTNYALYSRLKNYYNLINIPIDYYHNDIGALFFGCFDKISNKALGNDLGMKRMKYMNRKYAKTIPEDGIVFHFEECPSYNIGKYHYYFQDVSAEFLLENYQNHYGYFDHSVFQDIRPDALKRRVEIQEDFYNHTSFIFTMGKWLANRIKLKYGYTNVCSVGGV